MKSMYIVRNIFTGSSSFNCANSIAIELSEELKELLKKGVEEICKSSFAEGSIVLTPELTSKLFQIDCDQDVTAISFTKFASKSISKITAADVVFKRSFSQTNCIDAYITLRLYMSDGSIDERFECEDLLFSVIDRSAIPLIQATH